MAVSSAFSAAATTHPPTEQVDPSGNDDPFFQNESGDEEPTDEAAPVLPCAPFDEKVRIVKSGDRIDSSQYHVPDIPKEVFEEIYKSIPHAGPFFRHEHLERGRGAKWLVATVFNREDEAANIGSREVAFHLVMVFILTLIPVKYHYLLAWLFETIVLHMNKKETNFKHTYIPTTLRDIRKRYTTSVGSIMNRLPLPKIVDLPGEKCNQSVTSLVDGILIMLAQAKPVDPLLRGMDPNVPIESMCFNIPHDGVSNTLAALQLFDELSIGESRTGYTLKMAATTWSDGFEASTVKDNRGGEAWMKTITIAPIPGSPSTTNTLVTAIAPSSDDHSVVEEFANEDFAKLSTGKGVVAYHGGTRELIYVKVGNLLTNQDRIERISTFQVGSATGNWSRYWGVAGVPDDLHACEFCRYLRLHTLKQLTPESPAHAEQDMLCPKCVDWDILRKKSEPPAKYPDACADIKDYAPNDEVPKDGVPQPPPGREVGLTSLSSLSITRIGPLVPPTKRWTKVRFQAYLTTFGLTNKYIDKLCDLASEGLDWNLPAMWHQPGAFERLHFAPMHLLFLGHAKMIFEILSEWFSSYKLFTKFVSSINVLLGQIKDLRVQRFAAMPLSGSNSIGGWVSENLQGFARLGKFIIVFVIENNLLGAPGKQDKVIAEWTVIQRLLSSFIVCISALMSEGPDMKGEIDLKNKLYLDALQEADVILRCSKSKDAPNQPKNGPEQPQQVDAGQRSQNKHKRRSEQPLLQPDQPRQPDQPQQTDLPQQPDQPVECALR